MHNSTEKNNWPIVRVKTEDDLSLFGHFLEVPKSKCTVLHLHGTGGSFYWNSFYPKITKAVNQVGFS